MEKHDHFSHQHKLSFHKSLEGAQITCTGCNFPCNGTGIYSCRPCKFFLHEQCFNATRLLNHPSHPDHPLSLFPCPTYPSRSFHCNLCNKKGSGFCFCCTLCEFDIHVHCAYNNTEIKPKPAPISPQNQIKLKSHPAHPLHYMSNPPYDARSRDQCSCDVCGTICDRDTPKYRCAICDYDAHVECVSLPQIAKRADHAHELSLLHVNTHESFGCDVCKLAISQNNCMYVCKSGCDYGMHVKCVSATVTEKPEMDAMTFQLEMFKLQNQMRVHQMMIDTKQMGISGYNHNRYYRY